LSCFYSSLSLVAQGCTHSGAPQRQDLPIDQPHLSSSSPTAFPLRLHSSYFPPQTIPNGWRHSRILSSTPPPGCRTRGAHPGPGRAAAEQSLRSFPLAPGICERAARWLRPEHRWCPRAPAYPGRGHQDRQASGFQTGSYVSLRAGVAAHGYWRRVWTRRRAGFVWWCVSLLHLYNQKWLARAQIANPVLQ